MDIDAAMRRQCTHVNSQARGDILVRATDVEITDRVQGQGCSRKQFVLDVKTVAMVDGNGNWGERWILIQINMSILVCWMLNK